MHLIKEIYRSDFDSSFTPNPNQKYNVRKAARAILIKDHKLALLNVTKQKLHQLPGGGIDKGETIEQALLREIDEETGCDARILKKLGLTIEYRDEIELIQISYVFIAEVIGEPHELNLMEDESNKGFVLEWIEKDKVLEIIEKDNPADFSDNKYMSLRDKEILKFYLKNQ